MKIMKKPFEGGVGDQILHGEILTATLLIDNELADAVMESVQNYFLLESKPVYEALELLDYIYQTIPAILEAENKEGELSADEINEFLRILIRSFQSGKILLSEYLKERKTTDFLIERIDSTIKILIEHQHRRGIFIDNNSWAPYRSNL